MNHPQDAFQDERSVFNDRLAKDLEWTHVNSEDAYGDDRKLVQVDPNTYKLKLRSGANVFKNLIWLGVLLIPVLILEAFNVHPAFSLILTAVGLLLSLLNLRYLLTTGRSIFIEINRAA